MVSRAGGITLDVREKMSSEKRLIDAGAVREKRKRTSRYFDVVFDVEEMPTVDVVEVVRCRECKYHYWEQEPCHGKSVHYCKLPHMRGVEVFKEFFCYYGERKEGAD